METPVKTNADVTLVVTPKKASSPSPAKKNVQGPSPSKIPPRPKFPPRNLKSISSVSFPRRRLGRIKSKMLCARAPIRDTSIVPCW